MGTRDAVLKLVERVLKCDRSELVDHAHLRDDLGVGSILRMDLLVAIERHFKIKFCIEEIHGVQTLGDVIRATEGRTQSP